ncbi:MAG: dihydroneopterin aldolase [Gemmatimonadaceae bacterium]
MGGAAPARRLSVKLAGMRFHVRAGVLPHEREIPQPIEVDLAVRCAADSDSVLDYCHLYAIVRDVASGDPIDYLETIADRIALAVVALEGVERVRVAVRKPHVALGGPLDFAEIVVEYRA